MAIKMALALEPANVSNNGFAIADARHIGGHKVVASLAELYALADWKLQNIDETDTDLALGQQWYVKGAGSYRLTNWANRKSAAGWTKVVDPNNIDTTLFQVVTTLPTSDIKRNQIYLVPTSETDPNGGNKFHEYVYTGTVGGTYDATAWEKLGEYKAEYKPEVATMAKLGCVKSLTVTPDKGDTASPAKAPVEVASNGYMTALVRAARTGLQGVVGVDHTETKTSDGYETALETDTDGNGFVTIGVIADDTIDAMFV